jgi:hypothetical protein
MQTEPVEDAGESFKKIISEEIKDRLEKQGIAARGDLINVWGCTFLFEGDVSGDLNITITDENFEPVALR